MAGTPIRRARREAAALAAAAASECGAGDPGAVPRPKTTAADEARDNASFLMGFDRRKAREALPKGAKTSKDLLAHAEFVILDPTTPPHDRVRAIETVAKISGFVGQPDIDEDVERKRRIEKNRKALSGTAKVRAALKKYLRENTEARAELLRICAELEQEGRPKLVAPTATPTPSVAGA